MYGENAKKNKAFYSVVYHFISHVPNIFGQLKSQNRGCYKLTGKILSPHVTIDYDLYKYASHKMVLAHSHFCDFSRLSTRGIVKRGVWGGCLDVVPPL